MRVELSLEGGKLHTPGLETKWLLPKGRLLACCDDLVGLSPGVCVCVCLLR